MFIYQITNNVNGNIYIGQTIKSVERRFKEHRSSLRRKKHVNRYLQNAWNKYGEVNFSFNIIAIATNKTELNDLESYFIRELDSTNNSKGYNIEPGGGVGRTVSQYTREKLRQAHTGRKASNETKLRMSKSQRGRIGPNRGKTFSEEVRKRMSKGKTGSLNHKSKKLIDSETGTVFQSITEAAKILGLNYSTLRDQIYGRHPNKTALRFKG